MGWDTLSEMFRTPLSRTLSDTLDRQFLLDEVKREDKGSSIPFHRIGLPGEIAKIALFLASYQ